MGSLGVLEIMGRFVNLDRCYNVMECMDVLFGGPCAFAWCALCSGGLTYKVIGIGEAMEALASPHVGLLGHDLQWQLS